MKKHLNAAPKTAAQEVRVAYMQRMLRLVAEASPYEGAPVLVSQIEALPKEMFGIERDFSKEKDAFNELMLSLETGICARIEAADDPLYAAIQFAMIGNYIDFGAMDRAEVERLNELMENSARFVPGRDAYEAFRTDVLAARTLVYLTDNCGEIVMDKLLIRQMKRLNPSLSVTVITRGAPILNDATVEHALFCGLDEHARVIGNGSGIAGTCFSDISEEAKSLIDGADLLVSKGQANFETLRRCGKNVYYIFLCKCDMFARRFGVERFQGMLLRDAES